ncbi:hypothetical protein BO94DRAFT_286268 [Aspergillus sclerotioniger CBS 115572]|uniref:Uncharacterized protein n=1 Tax=Aspergillus sclerotioniger CBS 115572 TaxID=1450535 RepID=A0A317X8C1_9EURO|nr:hypothetical protein BO94DRAFT_286268 [Aspergillus sclerotioniger CBS 115572]PWY94854.1 hypothetical protein BO94DRAFT_286268 [Aspergillus sclerotioniger CBS 115572]
MQLSEARGYVEAPEGGSERGGGREGGEGGEERFEQRTRKGVALGGGNGHSNGGGGGGRRRRCRWDLTGRGFRVSKQVDWKRRGPLAAWGRRSAQLEAGDLDSPGRRAASF